MYGYSISLVSHLLRMSVMSFIISLKDKTTDLFGDGDITRSVECYSA